MRILRVVGSRTLPCGCLTGLYETYSGACVELLDHISENCVVTLHREGPALRTGGMRRWLRRAVAAAHLGGMMRPF
jgi:hypothetical protein